MLPREFGRRLRAHRERLRAEDELAWGRTLHLSNRLGDVMNVLGCKPRQKPLTLDELKRRAAVATPQPGVSAPAALSMNREAATENLRRLENLLNRNRPPARA